MFYKTSSIYKIFGLSEQTQRIANNFNKMDAIIEQKKSLNAFLKKDALLTLFIVGTNTIYLGLLKDKFSQNKKYNIYTFSSDEDCLKNLYLKPDLILLDYNFPEETMNSQGGHHILEVIIKKLPRTKVVMISDEEKNQLLSSDYIAARVADPLPESYEAAAKIRKFTNDLVAQKNRKHCILVFVCFAFLITFLIITLNLFLNR